jgi:predicted small secreted protein
MIYVDVVERNATTTGVGRDLEEAAEMGRRSGAGRRLMIYVDVVERNATTTGVGRDLEEAAEMGRRSGAGCSNYRSRQIP